MPKSRDSNRTNRPQDGAAPPEQAAVERALEQIVERLKPKAPDPKPAKKGDPRTKG
ncbi:UNVERIFIED_ORG: hypothetical protein M2438_002532 [Methylobacterium sp. SuP10 SLI 274]|jgi:hypothetical protein|nr:hypothetical protein [Methylorubrum extorquens]MDF9863756.1 hypothetical protein [Methylorubrum pseudosasae]MDH6637357.1 hypothetical protein [Methylobacterium sp. SuP10 SLI 274]MDH6666536.1 hypothetical protein [Methylorubrum zatmanii]MCP1558447.1 hypothetical protein [Methylorubrum extorquens]MDF9792071.1 hypothetical protein [Methylorubrum extorquens]